MRKSIATIAVASLAVFALSGCGGDKKVEDRVSEIQTNAPAASAPIAADVNAVKTEAPKVAEAPKADAKAPETPKLAQGQTSPEGKQIFTTRCVACHGEKGEGKATYPKLAGLSKEDALKMLKGYVDGSYGKAQKMIMAGQAKGLDDAQKAAVTEYIGSLK